MINTDTRLGDEVLVAFTRFVKATLPKDACFGRLGGEEFGVFLPGNGTDSYEVLDALRRETETLTIMYQAVQIPITISIGAASITTAGACFDTLAAAADRALYIAKDNGRNQVGIYSPAQGVRTILDKAQEMPGGTAKQLYQLDQYKSLA